MLTGSHRSSALPKGHRLLCDYYYFEALSDQDQALFLQKHGGTKRSKKSPAREGRANMHITVAANRKHGSNLGGLLYWQSASQRYTPHAYVLVNVRTRKRSAAPIC